MCLFKVMQSLELKVLTFTGEAFLFTMEELDLFCLDVLQSLKFYTREN